MNQVAVAFGLKKPLEGMTSLAEAIAAIPATDQAADQSSSAPSRIIFLIEDQNGRCHFH
jgi:hypothetical protein